MDDESLPMHLDGSLEGKSTRASGCVNNENPLI
jgi:hypothetical protein